MSNQNIISVKSSKLALLMNGEVLSILRPWCLILDTNKMQLTIKRRNWHLISHDEATYLFKSVRNIKIDRHLFGANLSIKVYTGQAEVCYISKRKAKKIQEFILSKSWNKKDTDILIDL